VPGGPPLRVALAGGVCFGGMKSKIVLSLRSSSARQSQEPTGLPPIDTKQPGSPGSCAPTPLRPPPRASSGLTSVVGNTSGPGRTPPPPARAHRPPVRSRDGTTEASALDGAVCNGECGWHAQYRGTTNRRNNQPSQSETNKPTVHFRWEPPGAYHPVRSSEQPSSPNHPSNQPVQTQQTE
jgi:hypothetical protein